MDRHSRLRDGFAATVVNSQRMGYVASDVSPSAVAAAVLGMIEGIENQWLVDPDGFDPVEALRSGCRALSVGLAVAGEPDPRLATD
jgi:hypothetical protein